MKNINKGQLKAHAGIKSGESSCISMKAVEIATLTQKPEHKGQPSNSPKNAFFSSSHSCQSSQVKTSSSSFSIRIALNRCRGRWVLNQIVSVPHAISAPRT